MRYASARSHTDKLLHVIYVDDDFNRVPQPLRALGPWQGYSDGDLEKLKLHYRMMLNEQGFAVIYQSVRTLRLEIAD